MLIHSFVKHLLTFNSCPELLPGKYIHKSQCSQDLPLSKINSSLIKIIVLFDDFRGHLLDRWRAELQVYILVGRMRKEGRKLEKSCCAGGLPLT